MGVECAYRQYDVRVFDDGLRDARVDHSNTVLTGAGSFDDRYVRVADVLFDGGAQLRECDAALGGDLAHGTAADGRRRPYEHARCSVLADDICVDGTRTYSEPL